MLTHHSILGFDLKPESEYSNMINFNEPHNLTNYVDRFGRFGEQ